MLSLGNYLVHSVYHNVKLLFAIGARGTPIVSSPQGFPPPTGQEAPLTCSCCPCACYGTATGHWQFHTCQHERRHNCGDVFCRGQRWTRNARPHPPPCRCCRSHRCCNPVCNRNRSRSPLYPEALRPDRTRTRRRHCPHESRSCIACLHCEYLSDDNDSYRQGIPSSGTSASRFISGHEEDDVGSGDFLTRNGGNDSDVDSSRFHRTSSCHTSTTKFVTCQEEVDRDSKDGTDVSDNESEILCDTNDKQICEREEEKEDEIDITQKANDCEKNHNKKEVEILNVFINRRLRGWKELTKLERTVKLENEELSDSQSSSILFGINECSEDEGERVRIDDFDNNTTCTGSTDKSDKTSGSGVKSTRYVRTFTNISLSGFTECFDKDYDECPGERSTTGSWVGPADSSKHYLDEKLSRRSGISLTPCRGVTLCQRNCKILHESSDELCHSYEEKSKKSQTECVGKGSCGTSCENPDKSFPQNSDIEVKSLKKPSDQSFCITPEESSEGTTSWETHDSLTLSPPKSNEKVPGRCKKSLKRKLVTNSESPLKINEKVYLDRRSGDVGNETDLESFKRTRIGNSKACLAKKLTESGSTKLGKEQFPEDRRKNTIERKSRRKAKVNTKKTQTILLNPVNRKVVGISHESRSDVNGKIAEERQEKRSKDSCWGKARLNLKRHPKDSVSRSSEYSFITSSGVSFKRTSNNNLDDREHFSPKKKRKDSCVGEYENIRQKVSKKKSQRNLETCSRRCIIPRVEIRDESHTSSLCGTRNTSKRSQNKRQYKSSNSEVSSELNSSYALSRDKKGIVSENKPHFNSYVSRAAKSPKVEAKTSNKNYFANDAIVNNEHPSVVEVWHCSLKPSESSILISCESTESSEENTSLDSDTGSGRHYKRRGLPISSGRRKFAWNPKFARKVVCSERVVDLTQSGHSRHWRCLDSQFHIVGKPSRKPMGKGQVSTRSRKCMFLSLRGVKKVTVNPFINFYLVYLRNMQEICPKCAPVRRVAAEAGKIWRCMNERDRKPFLKMALAARSHFEGFSCPHGLARKERTVKSERRPVTSYRHSAAPKPPPVYKNEPPKIRQNQRSVGTDTPSGRVGRRKRAATYPRERMDYSPLRLFMIKRRKEDKESNTERFSSATKSESTP